jgi:hypothetical protein
MLQRIQYALLLVIPSLLGRPIKCLAFKQYVHVERFPLSMCELANLAQIEEVSCPRKVDTAQCEAFLGHGVAAERRSDSLFTIKRRGALVVADGALAVPRQRWQLIAYLRSSNRRSASYGKFSTIVIEFWGTFWLKNSSRPSPEAARSGDHGSGCCDSWSRGVRRLV